MPTFQYKARTAQGQEVTGQQDSVSIDALANQLLSRGITPTEILPYTPKTSFSERWREWRSGGRIDVVDLIMFCRQMYTITKAGIPLIKGLRGLSASLQNPIFKRTLDDVVERLETGVELSSALSQHPDTFDQLFISLIHVGENSGQLDSVFLQLAQYLERDLETKKSILTALRYPSFVMIALVAAMAILNWKVIPVFAEMFSRFDAELPLVTRILIGTSDFFVNYWWHILIGGIAIGFGVYRYIHSESGSLVWGQKKLNMPLVGDLITRASMARYTRSLGLMLRSGVPLPQSLQLCSRVIDNPYLSQKIETIRHGVERGESLFITHHHSEMLTPLVMQMISVGEESGQVDTLLTEVAEFYEREVEYDLKSLNAKIEPIMIVIMAGVVGVLAMGIFLPMWDLYQVQQK